MKCSRCPRRTALPTPVARRNFGRAGGELFEILWLCDSCALVEDDAL